MHVYAARGYADALADGATEILIVEAEGAERAARGIGAASRRACEGECVSKTLLEPKQSAYAMVA